MRLILLEGTHRSCDERTRPHGRQQRNTDESVICGGGERGGGALSPPTIFSHF